MLFPMPMPTGQYQSTHRMWTWSSSNQFSVSHHHATTTPQCIMAEVSNVPILCGKKQLLKHTASKTFAAWQAVNTKKQHTSFSEQHSKFKMRQQQHIRHCSNNWWQKCSNVTAHKTCCAEKHGLETFHNYHPKHWSSYVQSTKCNDNHAQRNTKRWFIHMQQIYQHHCLLQQLTFTSPLRSLWSYVIHILQSSLCITSIQQLTFKQYFAASRLWSHMLHTARKRYQK